MSKLYDILNSLVTRVKKVETTQPDWSQNDPTAADYVKNRTHYEETTVVNEPLNITWDGNPDGLVGVMGTFYKVSDLVLTDEQIRTVTIYANGEDPFTGEKDYTKFNDNISVIGTGTADAVFVNVDNAEVDGFVFPKAGIYAMSVDGMVVSPITTTEPIEQTKTVVHKLDEKYLPDDVGGGSDRVTVLFNADGYTSDKTLEEILQELNGKGSAYLDIISTNTHGNVSTRAFEVSVYDNYIAMLMPNNAAANRFYLTEFQLNSGNEWEWINEYLFSGQSTAES